jgi:hypothetical protein
MPSEVTATRKEVTKALVVVQADSSTGQVEAFTRVLSLLIPSAPTIPDPGHGPTKEDSSFVLLRRSATLALGGRRFLSRLVHGGRAVARGGWDSALGRRHAMRRSRLRYGRGLGVGAPA